MSLNEDASLSNMVEPIYGSPYLDDETLFDNDLMLECLCTSDSEDWDVEIDSMSSTAMHSFVPVHNEYNNITTGNQYTRSITNAPDSAESRKQSTLQHGFGSSDNPNCHRKEYFDNESFPQGPVQRNSEIYLGDESSLTDQNSHYYHKQKQIDHNLVQTRLQHDKRTYSPPDEIDSNVPHTKSDESLIQHYNVPSERRFVKDILTNFQDSIPHDICGSEASVSNPGQTFDYENMFQWDYMEKLTRLEAVFTQEDKSNFYDMLKETLNFTQPYSFLLYLIENHYSNVIEGKKSLAHVALTQFDKWRSEGLFADMAPTEMEKDRALWIVTTRKLYLFDLCNIVFKLDSKGNEYLQRHIYYLLQSKKRYKEVSHHKVK